MSAPSLAPRGEGKIFGLALVVVLGDVGGLGRSARELRFAPQLAGKQSPAKRQGLILLVSNEMVTRSKATPVTPS